MKKSFGLGIRCWSGFRFVACKPSATCGRITALICSAVLAGVYAVTKEPIDETNKAILKASIAKVLPEGGEISDAQTCEVGGQPSECWFSTKDGEVMGTAVKSTVVGFGGPLTLMVGILPDGTVYNTSVLSHSETPGLARNVLPMSIS